jgi:plasmid maintenance system antidote protein VapI
MSKQHFVPAEYFSPGEYIDDELAARSCTRAGLARAIGESAEYLNALCDGSKPILVTDAERLALFFGGTHADTWMRLSRTFRQRPKPPTTGTTAL